MNIQQEHKLHIQNYSIYFSQNLRLIYEWVCSKSYSKVFVLCDTNTERDCLSIVPELENFPKCVILPGEKHKNLDTCKHIWDFLIENQADRKSLIILLGGGVVSDMGAFCASTYKRGVHFINIPTTLLAQVDATVGGKTGIDYNFQKNMLGLFSAPQAIFLNPLFLKSLPKKEFQSGYAEMLKHGLLKSNEYWQKLLKKNANIESLILESVNFKKSIVEKDPFEEGFRKILNFGHTIGHAIESFLLEKNIDVTHGEAIAWGMIAEIWLSNKLLKFDNCKMNTIVKEISKRYPFQNKFERSCFSSIIDFMYSDKKNNHNKILAVLLEDIGKPKIDIALSRNDITDSLEFLISIYK